MGGLVENLGRAERSLGQLHEHVVGFLILFLRETDLGLLVLIDRLRVDGKGLLSLFDSLVETPGSVRPVVVELFLIDELAVGIVAAWRRMGLFPVAAICCAIVYLMDSVIM